jgi:hypothetical protein
MGAADAPVLPLAAVLVHRGRGVCGFEEDGAMKKALLTVAVLSLVGCVWTSWSHFIGNLPKEAFLMQIQLETLAWFVSATWWAYKK